MSVTIGSQHPSEVGLVNSTAAGLVEGVLLAKSRVTGYDYALATDLCDAVLLSEIVTDAECMKRQYLMHDIDFSGYTRVGETSAIAKRAKGAVCYGLALTPQVAEIPAGTRLQVVAGFLAPKTTGKVIGIALDSIVGNATTTRKVLLLNTPV